MQDTIKKILNAVSGDRTYRNVEEISNFHRIQASTGYRAAAKHVTSKLLEYGLDAKIKSYPADGKTWFLTSKMFKEWHCENAYLKLCEETGKLADFKAHNLSVIQRSYACDYRNQPLDIVLLDKGSDPQAYEGLDLKGKLIFVHDDFNEYMDWAIKEKGAVGFVTDFMREQKDVRERYDLQDNLNYISFWWKHTEAEPQTLGFVLTPRAGDKLTKRCLAALKAHAEDPSKPQYLQATCYVDSKLYEGEIEVVDTLLKGETDEEVLIVSHLCHPRPSANDNASGVAASIEAVKVLKDLTENHDLPGLKRSVRMIFIPEFTGTYAFLADLGENVKKIKAGINVDMVGGRQSHGYGPLNITGVPHANPSFITNLAAMVLDEVRKNAPSHTKDNEIAMFNSRVTGFEGGSDHFILSDPQVNVPTIMLGQWPDINYHSGGDTIEVIDPFILHKSAAICASFVYLLSNLQAEDLGQIMLKNRARFVEETSHLIDAAVENDSQAGLTLQKISHYSEFYKGCNLSLLTYNVQGKNIGLKASVSQENGLIDLFSKAISDRYLADYQPGFEAPVESIDEKYNFVPVRKFAAAITHLDDYAAGDQRKMEAYKRHNKDYRAALYSGHTFDAVVGYYMDGKRTLYEIAKEAVLETRDGSLEYTYQYVQLLHTLGLVDIKEKNHD
jgi:aminopeptidase-like protein